MSTPALTQVRPGTIAPEWRVLLMPLATGLVLLGALFNQEIVAAVQTWNASTAYNHCFLIIPISIYLLWDRRFELVGLAPRPTPLALLFGLPLGVAWLLAERLGIMEGRQLVALSFVELLFLAVLGKRLWWAMAGPLLYLYFLVPFGEFLTPKLQDVTTFFVRHGLEILGVPAYIDGYVIEIPQGTFFVAEACAGLRFLIASIAFGCLYALMMYRGPGRRTIFIAVSIVVPIIANGFRAVGIVYLGHLLGSAEAAAADHLIYGWIFFSAVILLLIALGLPFRQDQPMARSTRRSGLASAPQAPSRELLTAALWACGVAAIAPAVAGALTMATPSPMVAPARIELAAGCSIQPMGDTESNAKSQRVQCGGLPMDMTWKAFSSRSTAAPVMAERRRMVIRAATEGLSESWLGAGDGVPSAWRIMRSNDPAFLIAVSIWVDGRPVRPGLTMRLRMAINSLFGSDYAPMVVSVTPVVDWDNGGITDRRAAESGLPAFLLSHPDLDRTMAALSRLR